jgi:NADPH:quinone reductase-like Zn-dependent oxidoreductase
MSSVLDNAVQGICGTPFDSMVQKFKTSYLLTRTTRYCPYESCKQRYAEWKHDLEYLMELLARGKINPKVHSRVTLSDVPYIHQLLETEDVHGVIVCKPWK